MSPDSFQAWNMCSCCCKTWQRGWNDVTATGRSGQWRSERTNMVFRGRRRVVFVLKSCPFWFSPRWELIISQCVPALHWCTEPINHWSLSRPLFIWVAGKVGCWPCALRVLSCPFFPDVLFFPILLLEVKEFQQLGEKISTLTEGDK